MLTINTNLSSLIAQSSMKSSTNKLNQAIERMTTGFKINHAKDNAANYSIATNMTTKIGAYNVAEDNAAMGLDLINTAEGTLSQIEDKLQRLRALAEQASNGTYGEQSKQAINAEANALVDEIERIYNNSEYNAINLMKGRVTGTEESKFIKDIDRRDTSKMTTLASVDENEKLEYATYSISTAEELAKLATMTDNGLIGADTEFVLANDIDLSGYSNWTPIGNNAHTFRATFDGNGYVVSGLMINSSENYQGFFGVTTNATITNLALEDFNVDAGSGGSVGGLIGQARQSSVSNIYVTGILNAGFNAGGLIGFVTNSSISDSYSEVDIAADDANIGGLVGCVVSSVGKISNCYSAGSVTAMASATRVGGFIGVITQSLVIDNCYSTASVIANSQVTLYDDFIASYTSNTLMNNCTNPIEIINNATINNFSTSLDLQIGIHAAQTSYINIDTGYFLDSLSLFRRIGAETSDYLTMIDKMLAQASEKQTMFGATSNRLESVLEEITIQRDNLVSSRSTIRDADIAEVSSHYIQQQILQQAAATLLATANQSPSIALQLI